MIFFFKELRNSTEVCVLFTNATNIYKSDRISPLQAIADEVSLYCCLNKTITYLAEILSNRYPCNHSGTCSKVQ